MVVSCLLASKIFQEMFGCCFCLVWSSLDVVVSLKTLLMVLVLLPGVIRVTNSTKTTTPPTAKHHVPRLSQKTLLLVLPLDSTHAGLCPLCVRLRPGPQRFGQQTRRAQLRRRRHLLGAGWASGLAERRTAAEVGGFPRFKKVNPCETLNSRGELQYRKTVPKNGTLYDSSAFLLCKEKMSQLTGLVCA